MMRRALLLAILSPVLPCVSASFPSAVTPVALAVPAGQPCNDAVTSHGYSCTIAATGEAGYNTWAVTTGASSFTPAGFSVVVDQGLAIIQSTAVANTTSPINFTLHLTDYAKNTASINLSITTVSPETGCGFPKYPCARNDSKTAEVTSMGTVPPDAGANHCTAGAAGDLQSCGNVMGLNTMITEANYNNAQIVRASDYQDIQSGCIPTVGQGGAAGYNIFDSASNYFLIGCTSGWTRIKWFDPSAMQIDTSIDPRGYVHNQSGSIFSVSTGQVKFAYKTPARFFVWAGTEVTRFTITSGVVDAAATIMADYSYAIPCWNSATDATTPGGCGDWVKGTYQPGANIYPQRRNATPMHSFQLVNRRPCTTGTRYPNFLPATRVPPATPPGSAQYVLNDGTCQWADMSIPPGARGGQISWTAGSSTDVTDKVFSVAMSNNQGQDAAGACFVAIYNSSKTEYDHVNTCTGNVYNTVCTGGRGYACVGGTWAQIYTGNIYTDNRFPGGRNNRVVMHGISSFGNGQWTQITYNNCALVDLRGAKLYCPAAPSQPNGYIWKFGTSHVLSLFDWIGTGTPGHSVPGFNVFGYSNFMVYLQLGANGRGPNRYQGKNLITGHHFRYFDQALRPCTPNPCFIPQLNTQGQPNGYDVTAFDFDQHISWVTNHGSDDVPQCMETYGASGASGFSLWPPQYPWLGEVICFATDGSKTIAREAYAYSTQTSVYFNLQFNIGSLSSDGAWWAFSSDWWCTLGNSTGGAATVCGLPWQPNHAYQVGEYLGPIQYNSGVPGRIYRVTRAGTSGRLDTLAAADWCNTTGCRVKSGTAVFRYVGKNDAQPSVFLLKLQ